MYRQLKLFFDTVVIAKPRASRNSSIESFVVCNMFKSVDDQDFDELLEPQTRHYYDNIEDSKYDVNIPFVACGQNSDYDADMNYPLDVSKRISLTLLIALFNSLE